MPHIIQPPAPAATPPVVDEELLKVLPPIIKGVVRALGFARARWWLGEYGGVAQHIPKFKGAALGLDTTELERLRTQLKRHIDANGRIDLPKADKLFQLSRDAHIRNERRGTSERMLARRYNLCARQIRNIYREGDDDQLDLF